MPNRHLFIIVLLISIITAPFTTARAGDKDFDLVVRHLKQECGARQKGLFGMSLARFFVRVAKPAGVKSFNVAIFEDIPGLETASTRLSTVLSEKLSADWQQVVRVYSKRNREETYIYLRAAKKDVEILLVDIDRTDAVVVKAKLSPDALQRFLKDRGYDTEFDIRADLNLNDL